MSFDLCNRTLKIQESIWDFNFQHGSSFGSVRVHSPTLFAFMGACNVTPRSFSWSTTLQTLALVVATLALDQGKGVTRLWAKRETHESLHMLPGVQRVWGHEPSHSRGNSHVRNWSPKWTPESSKCNCRGQNPFPWKVIYIIKKILKCRCLKWALITHLNICSTSYGQKKGRESN